LWGVGGSFVVIVWPAEEGEEPTEREVTSFRLESELEGEPDK